MRITYTVIVGMAFGVAIAPAAQSAGQQKPFPFSCATFPPGVSAADLSERFGKENVQTAPVPWGGAEGDYNEGTVLFSNDPNTRLEIYWTDTAGKRDPQWVSVRGDRSRWQTPERVTLGTSLKSIEALNRRPFRLLGFATDASGTVMSWSNGRLSTDSSECRVRMRLRPAPEKTDRELSPLYRQLLGEREFSSGHPAMQALDPSVYELFIQYR